MPRLLRRELHGDLSRDHGLRHIALQGQHVAEVAIVAIGPERLVAARRDRAARSRARARRRGGPNPRARRRRSARARSPGSVLVLPLYCIAEVREMTRSALMRDRSEMIASVRPSAKYSWVGSPETLRSGSTAIARMVSCAGVGHGTGRGVALPSERSAAATAAAVAGRRAGSLLRQASINSVECGGRVGAERAHGGRRVAEDLEHQRLGALLDERPPARGHLEEHHAEGVDVGAGCRRRRR